MDNSATSEVEHLERIAAQDPYSTPVNAAIARHSAQIALRWAEGRERLLELGPAGGLGTAILKQGFQEVTVVDAASSALESVRREVPNARVHQALFEQFVPEGTFDMIVMGHVLEHVEDPKRILERYVEFLSPRGVLFVAVPNALSYHRLIGVSLGFLTRPDELNSEDLRIGHRRVYTADRLTAELGECGLRVVKSGGFFLKTFSSAQIERVAQPAALDALMLMGERAPLHAAEIYSVAKL